MQKCKPSNVRMPERLKQMERLKRCINCLGVKHTSTNCFSKSTCRNCGQRHHTLHQQSEHHCHISRPIKGMSRLLYKIIRTIVSPLDWRHTTNGTKLTKHYDKHLRYSTAIQHEGSTNCRNCQRILSLGQYSSNKLRVTSTKVTNWFELCLLRHRTNNRRRRVLFVRYTHKVWLGVLRANWSK